LLRLNVVNVQQIASGLKEIPGFESRIESASNVFTLAERTALNWLI
jgi:hypothetical protein